MDMPSALSWVIAVTAVIVTFLVGVYVSNRMYKAGYIDGYLDAMDDQSGSGGVINVSNFT